MPALIQRSRPRRCALLCPKPRSAGACSHSLNAFSRCLSPSGKMHAARFVADWPRVRASGVADFGQHMERPEWPIDSRPAAAAALHVRACRPEREADLHAALFDARFKVGTDISDPVVVRSTVERVAGADACVGLAEALRPTAMEEALAHDRREALRLVVGAVPAIVVGERLLIGAQRPAVIRGILAQAALGASR